LVSPRDGLHTMKRKVPPCQELTPHEPAVSDNTNWGVSVPRTGNRNTKKIRPNWSETCIPLNTCNTFRKLTKNALTLWCLETERILQNFQEILPVVCSLATQRRFQNVRFSVHSNWAPLKHKSRVLPLCLNPKSLVLLL
jgi:hypothetical protein